MLAPNTTQRTYVVYKRWNKLMKKSGEQKRHNTHSALDTDIPGGNFNKKIPTSNACLLLNDNSSIIIQTATLQITGNPYFRETHIVHI